MTTSSSRRVIKSGIGQEIRVRRFEPPIQARSRPKEQADKTQEGKKTSRGGPRLTSEEAELQKAAGIIEGAKEESRQIMMRTNELTEKLLKEAREEAAQIKKKAFEEGYRQGFDHGVEEGNQRADETYALTVDEKLEDFRKDMDQALASVEQAKEACLKKYLDELKDCSVAVAEKVIRISLKSSGEIIKRMIVAETEKLKKTAWVKIYIEKSDYNMMTETDADVIHELSKLSDNIKFVVMEKENGGNCIIEMPEEIVDISVDTQMENIKEILENIRF